MKRALTAVLPALLVLAACHEDPGGLVVSRASAETYTPAVELKLEPDTKKALLAYARARWRGEPGTPAGGQAAKVGNPLVLGLFTRRGTLVGTWRVEDEKTNLNAKVEAAIELARKSPLKGFDGDRDKDVFLHLLPVTYTARLPNFGVKGLIKNGVFVPRVTGMLFDVDGKRTDLDPLVTLYRHLNPKLAQKWLERNSGIGEGRMNLRNDLWIEIYRVDHFGERYPDHTYGEFHRGHERFTHEQVDEAAVRASLKLVGKWYENNVIDGEVTYQYGVYSQKYMNEGRTMVRSTMAVWVLNRLATFLKDDKLRKLGEETIGFYLERYFQMEKSKAAGKVLPSPEPLSNGNRVKNRYSVAGFIAAAILERKDLDKYRAEVELLADFAMSFMREDGVFWTQFAQSQYFMPGQVMLCIMYVYEATKDPKYLKFVEKGMAAYDGPLRASMFLGDDRWGPIAPAWFTQPLTVLYRNTKDARWRDLIFLINDRVLKAYELNKAFASYYDYDGVLAPKPGFNGNNSITAAALESLVDGAWVARESGDTARYERYTDVARRTIAYLVRLQYTPANTYYVRHRSRVVGGFKKDLENNLVWMDNVWHLTSAFTKAVDYGILPKR